MKSKMKLLSVGIILVLIVFQYWTVLNEQRTPSSTEWSRSFPSNVSETDYSKIMSVPNEKGFAISLLNFKKMDLMQCSSEMQCNKLPSNPGIDPYKNTWSDGSATYFINKEGSFIRSTKNEGDTELASNVANFTKSGQTLVYWLNDQQVMIKQGEQPPVSYQSEFPVYAALVADDHVFIVTQDVQSNLFTVHDGTKEFRELFQFSLNPNESMSAMMIATHADHHDEYRILLDISKTSGGSVTKLIREYIFDLTEHQTAEMSKVQFADQATGTPLNNVRQLSVLSGESGTKITFSAMMYDSAGDVVNKIFTGNYNGSMVEAVAVTKKGDGYTNPVFVDEQTIAYFRLQGKEKHLMYSSSTDAKIAQSNDGLDGDLKEAMFTLISLLFNGLLLVLLSITWLIPTFGFGYGTLGILTKMYKPYAHTAAFWVNTLALVVSQLILFNTLFHPEKFVSNAPYLTEVSHVSFVIIISGIVSILPVLLTRRKVNDNNFNILILFTTGMNLLCLFFLLGPYFL